MMDAARRAKFVAAAGLACLFAGALAACGGAALGQSAERVYHCVDKAYSFAPDKTPRITHLDVFEYGDYRIEDRPTISAGGVCALMRVPHTAHVRYWLDERVVEKDIDLSALNAAKVRGKSVEFYFDGDSVELRLVTTVPGNRPIREVLLRQ